MNQLKFITNGDDNGSIEFVEDLNKFLRIFFINEFQKSDIIISSSYCCHPPDLDRKINLWRTFMAE